MIDRVDRNVQRLLHMLEGIKRLNEMLAGPELEPKIRAALATIPLPDDFTLPEV